MTIQWYACSFVDVFGQTGSLVVPASAFDDSVADGIPFDGSALELPLPGFGFVPARGVWARAERDALMTTAINSD